MGKKKGFCHICGEYVELTFEHIPPKQSGNCSQVNEISGDVLMACFADIERLPWDLKGLKYKQKQKGMGKHTLCQRCNNNTGSWYGEDYVIFSNTMAALLAKERPQPNMGVSFTIEMRPLNFIKQVLSLFCSINKYPLNTKSESTALPDINKNFEKIKESRKYCEYLNYNPQFNALVWLELKENYEALIQSSLAPHLFLELNSRLNTVLPLIMHSDQVLGKNILLDSSQKSAQDLIIQNLTMLTDNIKELRNHNDASLVQELQASANYQKMKMGKS